jgi:hypothetical protein
MNCPNANALSPFFGALPLKIKKCLDGLIGRMELIFHMEQCRKYSPMDPLFKINLTFK